MKKWLIIIGVILLILIVVGALYDAGYLNFEWQPLACIVAAIAGPFQMVKNKLFNGNNTLKELLQQNQEDQAQDIAHKEEYDKKIQEKETQIQDLERQLDKMDSRLRDLEYKKSDVSNQVSQMDSDEIKRQFEEFYANINEKDD